MGEPRRPALHRVIRLAGQPGAVRAVLEDDFHHFRVHLRHADGRVTGVDAESPRFPYSLCPAAGLRLRTLIGMALDRDPTAAFRIADVRDQCTHQFDLAALAVTAAARGTTHRRYDVRVEDGEPGRARMAELARDGVPLLRWTLDGYAVADPAPFAGVGLGSGFAAWVARTLDPEQAEAALVLRRGVFISGGRGMAALLDSRPFATATGGCWVQQPERASLAARQKGSTQDFSDRADLLTSAADGWLFAKT